VYQEKHQKFTHAHEAARILSGKWIVAVLILLAGGPRTHNDLARATGLEENKPLDRALHRLVSARLIDRTVHNVRGSGPRVRYCLTNRGYSVLPIIDDLAGWWQAVDVGQQSGGPE
jgi:DNA-binding HxlR family transcriptional regulator